MEVSQILKEEPDFSEDTEGFRLIEYICNHNRVVQEELLALYLFADEYDIPRLRRDVLDTLIKGIASL